MQVEGREESHSATMGAVDRQASALRFVYPFTFDGSRIEEVAAAADAAAWPGADPPLTIWERGSFPTDDLLAQVADFVAPGAGLPLSAALWRMPERTLRSPRGIGGGASHPGAHWTLQTRRGAVEFTIDSLELALFGHGVGFLIVGAAPTSEDTGDWYTFVHFFRYIAGQRSSPLRAVRITGDGAEPFFPVFASADPAGDHRTGELVTGLLRAASPSGAGGWWGEIFVPGMMLPYASLFIDDCAPDDVPSLLHRLRNFFHGDQVIHPVRDEAEAGGPALLPYAADQWFFHSLNGGGFLACNPPRTPFFRSTLPTHVRSQYFLLFLLALEQRFFLMQLSQQVSRRWVGRADGDDRERTAVFAGIRNALLAFTAQGYFPQTMQEEHHHRSYERWRQVFELEELQREVSSEVHEMHGQLELRERERAAEAAREQRRRSAALDHRLALITWLLGLPVSLLLVVNASGNIALVRHLLFGPAAVEPYDIFIGLGLELLGIAIGLIGYHILGRRMRPGEGRAHE